MHICLFLLNFVRPFLSKRPGKVLKNNEDVTNYNIDVANSASYLKNISDEIDANSFDEFEKSDRNSKIDIDRVLLEFEHAVIKSSSKYKKSVKRKHVNNREWFDGECLKHKKKAKKILKEFRTSRTVDNLNKYIVDKKRYKSLCKDKKRFYELNFIDAMENSIHNSRNFWKEIADLLTNQKFQIVFIWKSGIIISVLCLLQTILLSEIMKQKNRFRTILF